MPNPVVPARIVTCQGTIQLVTALSVLAYRAERENQPLDHYDNYLVIYDLFAPPGQLKNFITLIEKIATHWCHWKAIIYLEPAQLESIHQRLSQASPKAIFPQVYDWIGLDQAVEIYLCRNWQLGNQLMINAYASAEKICYGDSIGIYFSANSSAFFAASSSTQRTWREWLTIAMLRRFKYELANRIQRLSIQLGLKTILQSVAFDRGYFTLPEAMGEVPPMPHTAVPACYIYSIVASLTGLVNPSYVRELQIRIGTSPVAILLTSNFSEAGRMPAANEPFAYQQFLQQANLSPDTILLIKPHPRDGAEKLQQLQANLMAIFADVILLSEPSLFSLPFEIFLLAVFGKDVQGQVNPSSTASSDSTSAGTALSSIRIFAVSSACLSLKLLFGLSSEVGFGQTITSQYFYPHYAEGRLNHEQDLRTAILAIETQTVQSTSLQASA